MSSRTFRILLLVTTLVGLAIRIYVGLHTSINFDEWQHVFIASRPRWADLLFELKTNAHPPLFFLLLNLVERLGRTDLFRAISIASGAGSIVLVGLIAEKSFSSRRVSLLCSLAFALSADAISISCEIRSYQLAMFFSLGALFAWLSMEGSENTRLKIRPFLLFSLLGSLAVMTHYSAVFFLGGCAATLLIRSRRSLRFVLALAIPSIVFAIEYFVHAAAQSVQGYLFDFYRLGSPNESVVTFLGRNTGNFLNLFSPLRISNSGIATAILVLGAVAGVVLARKYIRSAVIVLVTGGIIVELAIAGVANEYPFGGLLRHQYIAGPFLLITAFALLDGIIAASRRHLQNVIVAAFLLATVSNLAAEWSTLSLSPDNPLLLQAEFDAWQSAVPGAKAVFVDHWGVIGYFIHTSSEKRSFVRSIEGSSQIDEYSLPSGAHVFYDKTDEVLDFLAPGTYQSFAACLHQAQIRSLAVFFFSPGDRPLSTEAAKLENVIHTQAALQGLSVTRVHTTQTTVSAEFALAAH